MKVPSLTSVITDITDITSLGGVEVKKEDEIRILEFFVGGEMQSCPSFLRAELYDQLDLIYRFFFFNNFYFLFFFCSISFLLALSGRFEVTKNKTFTFSSSPFSILVLCLFLFKSFWLIL